jgi:hypothetical protein
MYRGISKNVIPIIPEQSCLFMDGPGLSANLHSFADLFCDFKTYLRYRPDAPGSIYVTIGRIDWGFHGRTDGPPWMLNVHSVWGPSLDRNEAAFPQWIETDRNN